jgi:hypothetical protein
MLDVVVPWKEISDTAPRDCVAAKTYVNFAA